MKSIWKTVCRLAMGLGIICGGVALEASIFKVDPQPSFDGAAVLLGDEGYPPFEFNIDGQPHGISIDLMALLSKEIGKELKVELMGWSDAQASVVKGNADGHPLMGISQKRREFYDFTVPTFNFEFTLFTHRPLATNFGLDKMANKKIAFTLGGLPGRILSNRYPKAELIFTKDDLESIELLLSSKVDAFSTSRLAGRYQLAKHGVESIASIPQNLSKIETAIALRKGNFELLASLNKGIENLRRSGKITSLRNEWLQGNNNILPSSYPMLGLGLLLIFGTLLLFGGALLICKK